MSMAAMGLVKLLEECGELSQVAAKKIAYLPVDDHPDEGGSLKLRLQDEAADVIAAIMFVSSKFKFNEEEFFARVDRKIALFNVWDTAP